MIGREPSDSRPSCWLLSQIPCDCEVVHKTLRRVEFTVSGHHDLAVGLQGQRRDERRVGTAESSDNLASRAEGGVQLPGAGVTSQREGRRPGIPANIDSLTDLSSSNDVSVRLHGKRKGRGKRPGFGEPGNDDSVLAEAAVDRSIAVVANQAKASVVPSWRRSQLGGDGATHDDSAVALQRNRRRRGQAGRLSRDAEAFIDAAIGVVPRNQTRKWGPYKTSRKCRVP